MPLTINEDKLKEGLLGLVIALVEIIAEVLKLQAVKRITSGHLSNESIEKLGENIMDIEETIQRIKHEQGLADSVDSIRDQLDDLIDDFLKTLDTPEEIPETLR